MFSQAIEQPQQVPAGVVFWFHGRPLKVVKSHGTDDRAPVIVEELASFGSVLSGQYALWAHKAVVKCVGRASRARD